MALFLERIYPIVFGIAAVAIYLYFPAAREYKMPESVSALMAAVVSIGGISVGFLATAKSILVSIDEKDIIRRLKSSGYYKRIIGYIREAILWSFLLTFCKRRRASGGSQEFASVVKLSFRRLCSLAFLGGDCHGFLFPRNQHLLRCPEHAQLTVDAMQTKTCECGAVYELTEHDSPMRDVDSLQCEFCGATTMKWNGGCFYSQKLISPPPKKDSDK